ncbi:MAG: NifB/NifX family molybdenum-iron cluster-binding protein [Acidobacteria bacterium]|nr:NifB/NifX family molybdenum-iron cluster-binding protein [Acidobacteriota bacterium]
MKIAIPIAEGKLSAHFGHCETFTIFDIDADKREVKDRNTFEAPPHEPGLLPKWLADKGADIIIAGGIGQRAISLFEAQGIKVICGAPRMEGEQLIQEFMNGSLTTGDNLCDH